MTDALPRARSEARSVGDAWPEAWPTERENLEKELAEARSARSRSLIWTALVGVGPMAVVAVGLAALTGSLELAAGLFALGLAVEGLRIWRLDRTVRDLTRALDDPMDGS